MLARKIIAIKLLAAVLLVGMVGAFTYVILDAKKDAKQNAESAATTLATALAQDISRSFELYDSSLQSVVYALKDPSLIAALRDPGPQATNTERRKLAMFDYASKPRYLNRIAIIDADGRMIAESTNVPLPKATFEDRDYVIFHKTSKDDTLYFSKPMQSRVDQDWIITISRRFLNEDGSFGGIVAGSISLTYFQALFMNLDANRDDVFAVITSDGTLLSRSPFRLFEVGKNFGGSELLRNIVSKNGGIFDAASPIDGVRRMYAVARVPNVPLIVTYAPSEERIFAAWKIKAMTLSVMVLTLCAALIALGMILSRELRLRKKVELRLIASANRLKALSRIDGLTGLRNRRAFDERSEQEWKRAIRDKTTLSVLVIDVDHFKEFNDRNGHLNGDIALASVARSLRKHVKRPGDFAARYGGEEFVVILPSTSAAGARKVADDIRQSVALAHFSNDIPEGVTVSIGVATVSPIAPMMFADTFSAADGALYRAKQNGRNRVNFAFGTDDSADGRQVSFGR